MTRTIPRLFIQQDIIAGQPITLNNTQSHYVLKVMRLKLGDLITIFNGHQAEYQAQIIAIEKKTCSIIADTTKIIRPLTKLPAVHIGFALLKKRGLEFLLQKTTELGCMSLQPLIAQHSVARTIDHARGEQIMIEAAEQCLSTSLPILYPALPFQTYWQQLHNKPDPTRAIIVCDESLLSGHNYITQVLDSILHNALITQIILIIGPEGGFSAQERQMIDTPLTYKCSLGSRILRAETAALTALTLCISALTCRT